MTKSSSIRLPEIDLFRALAILGMVVFHFFYLLDYFEMASFQMHEGTWLFLARYVQFSFIGLVGICMALSWQKTSLSGKSFGSFFLKQARRGTILLLVALGVTLVTWLTVPDEYVRFGILHFISLSIILTSFLAPFPIISLLFAVIVIGINTVLPVSTMGSIWLMPLGISYVGFRTIDYFPLIPWLSVVAVGIAVGHLLYKGGQRRFQFPEIQFGLLGIVLSKTSSHSLLIYLAHVPLLMGLMLSYQFLFSL